MLGSCGICVRICQRHGLLERRTVNSPFLHFCGDVKTLYGTAVWNRVAICHDGVL